MYTLRLTKFGNPMLRQLARQVDHQEIGTPDFQQLIADLYNILDARKKSGVGLAAPQMGVPLAVAVISLKPTPYRPNVIAQKLTIINPKIVACYGRRTGMWEGCISFGASASAHDFPYAQTRRYKKIRLQYMDESGVEQEADFAGLMAHVLQHETDHLNGILFVDHVHDPKTYMLKSEYIRRYVRRKRVG